MRKSTWIAGIAGALGGVAWLGFKVPPVPFAPPDIPGQDRGTLTLPDGLPAPVQRYYRALTLFPRAASAYVSGRGRFLLAPLSLWVPMRWRAYFEPGHQFRWETDLTWFGRTVLRGCDEIIAGNARFISGRQVMTGDAIYRTECTVLWIYTLAFCPTALLELPGIEWEARDAVSARLHFTQYVADAPPLTLHFDPASSALTRVTTERFHAASGTYRPYQARFGVRRTMGGASLSKNVSAAWGDAFYINIELECVRYNIALPFSTEAV